jgi:hypothetical protein
VVLVDHGGWDKWHQQACPRRRLHALIHMLARTRTTEQRTILCLPQIDPASIPSLFFNILITQTPVSFSWFKMACCSGAGPL